MQFRLDMYKYTENETTSEMDIVNAAEIEVTLSSDQRLSSPMISDSIVFDERH